MHSIFPAKWHGGGFSSSQTARKSLPVALPRVASHTLSTCLPRIFHVPCCLTTGRTHPTGYLDHCAANMRAFLGDGVRSVLFVPFALKDMDAYADKARTRFAAMGYGIRRLCLWQVTQMHRLHVAAYVR